MANIKSQKKRIITNEKARMRNRAVRSELKTATRVVREAVETNDGAKAYAAALDACRLLDRAVTKGVIHKRQAANRKSGIMKLANTVVTAEDIAAYKPKEKPHARRLWLLHLRKRISAALRLRRNRLLPQRRRLKKLLPLLPKKHLKKLLNRVSLILTDPSHIKNKKEQFAPFYFLLRFR